MEMKKIIKQYLIKVGIKHAKLRRQAKEKIENDLIEATSQTILNFNKINELKKLLNEQMEYEIEGSKIRSRQILLPNEEKGSKGFQSILRHTKWLIFKQIFPSAATNGCKIGQLVPK